MASYNETSSRSNPGSVLLLSALCVGAALWIVNHTRRSDAFDLDFDTANDVVVTPTSLGQTTASAENTAGTLPFTPEETPMFIKPASEEDFVVPTSLGMTGASAERLRGEAPHSDTILENAPMNTQVTPAANDATVDTPRVEDNLGSENADLRSREFPVEAEADVYRADVLQQHNDSTDGEKFVAGGQPGDRPGDRQALGEVPNIMDQDEIVPDFRQQR